MIEVQLLGCFEAPAGLAWMALIRHDWTEVCTALALGPEADFSFHVRQVGEALVVEMEINGRSGGRRDGVEFQGAI